MADAKNYIDAMVDIKSLEASLEESARYMSSMDNWCMVHATKYMPLKKSDGTMYIPSTAMATNFDIPRSTVHVTLNHIVASHGYGSWDDTPIIVLAPYNGVSAKNGNPIQVAGTDTYWSVNPDKGLVLPESAYVIRPDDNGPLYKIGEHGATYKRDNYTEEEVAQIESLLDSYDRIEYEKYKNGNFESWEIEGVLLGDKRVRQMYDAAKDKQAFLRGLFEESRFEILSKYLRDSVTQLVMKKMGFSYVDSYDGGSVSEAIEKTAMAHGIDATASNKGHSSSVHKALEDFWGQLMIVFNGSSFSDRPGIFTAPDMDSLYNTLIMSSDNEIVMAIIRNLVENKKLDFAKLYEDMYASDVKSKISMVQISMKYHKQYLADVEKYNIPEENKEEQRREYQRRIQNDSDYIAMWNARKKMTDYDKNLAETIRRHCDVLSKQYDAWRNELVKKPGFDKLVQDLRGMLAMEYAQSRGHDNFQM